MVQMDRRAGLVATGLIIGLVLTACGQAAAPAEPANLWEEVQQEGVLVCGTSADFPPYEFVDENQEFAGFDIDLIREIGDRIGVEVEIQDMAFDSVIASVQERKVDCAIAALAASPERAEKVDFTISYKPRIDAAIAMVGSGVTLGGPEDFANYRVGVQSGGTNSKWVRENLVETGEMPEGNFFEYERQDQALLDLEAGRIDVVLTQAESAAEFAEDEDKEVVLVTTDMASADTVIAVPKGESELKAELDEAISEIIEDGTRNELLRKWEIPLPPEE